MEFKSIKNILLITGLATAASACTEDDYKLYDVSQKDSVFFEYRDSKNDLADEIEYAFNFDIATVHTIEIPVTLMGMPKDYDRTINIEVIADKSTMTEGVNYTITDNIIAANAVSGTVKVNLLRDIDPEILTSAKTLVLTIGENDDLRSVGENSFTITYSDIRPEVRPEWWSVSSTSPMPEYTFENAQLFFQYFYEYAPKADINLFNEMIDKYGDYFVRIMSAFRSTAIILKSAGHTLSPNGKTRDQTTKQVKNHDKKIIFIPHLCRHAGGDSHLMYRRQLILRRESASGALGHRARRRGDAGLQLQLRRGLRHHAGYPL